MHSSLPLYVSRYLVRSRDEPFRRDANRPTWLMALDHEQKRKTRRRAKRNG